MESAFTGFTIFLIAAGILSGAGLVQAKTRRVRFLPVGDSYTIGEGAEPHQSWPAVMKDLLKKKQIELDLMANPARTGFTTKNALDVELPILRKYQPEYASLMIGVNDWVQGVPPSVFRLRLAMLMDEISLVLPRKRNLIVVTIPDFSMTPMGSMFSAGRDIATGLQEFNQIIVEEAEKRGLLVCDLFELSRVLNRDAKNIAPDQLHPSALAYRKWAEFMQPQMEKLLKSK